MSKDKYRPSITDKEVVATSAPEEVVPAESTGTSLSPPPEDTTDLPGGPAKNAPTGLKVVSQKAYYSPEGQQFVEVVFEWNLVPGAQEYMLRIS